MRKRSVEERFWEKVLKTEEGCWLWTAGKFPSGYGAFAISHRKTVKASRYSYELHHGPFQKDLFVLHTCDQPSCVNPSHLFLGTHQDNMDDRTAKDRNHKNRPNPPPILITLPTRRPTLEENFWSMVEKTDGCWVWKGQVRHESGKVRGCFYIGREVGVLPQRFSYELHAGITVDPNKDQIIQSCGERLCVNPDHLSLRKRYMDKDERFWSKVDKTGECWVWTGYKPEGYGRFSYCENAVRTNIPAHRYSWELHSGKIPEGMFVCHQCDNPPCIRPEHLFLGSNIDNIVDSIEKKRHSFAKLTIDQVKLIRSPELATHSSQELATMFGVSSYTISKVLDRTTWAHLP